MRYFRESNLSVILNRKYMQGGQFKKDHLRMDDKVVIITGCNTGIGKETALDLARRGASVYMACRDNLKCEEARQEIVKKTGNLNVFNRSLDLASLDSVRRFVAEFLKEESRLDVLINNAGIMMCPKMLTKDGFEMQLGTNHLGHFLLTNLLLDVLKKSSPSRIINVSSMAHTSGKLNKEDLNSEQSYGIFVAYCQSKLANVLFTRELAKRLSATSVTVNSLHPGAVRTDLQRHVNPIFKYIMTPVTGFLFKNAKSGAQTQIRLAVDPELDKVTGKYFR